MPHTRQRIPFTRETVESQLFTACIGKTLILLDTVPSTNEYAKGLTLADGPHGTVVTAEEQTAGRGRLGRRWESSRSMNLLFSVLLRPDAADTERIPLVPFTAAVAVAEAIEVVTGLTVECKWPNDLLVSKKKVAGMLLESTMTRDRIEKLVLGIGVNVNQTEFPAEIQPQPTSLRIESGGEVDRVALLQHMLEEFEHRYLLLLHHPPEEMLSVWKAKTTMFSTRVSVRQTNGTLSGIAEDISPDGSLLLRTDDGLTHSVRAGDVSLGYDQPFMKQ